MSDHDAKRSVSRCMQDLSRHNVKSGLLFGCSCYVLYHIAESVVGQHIMASDTSLMVWVMRLQQTEALIEKRREDLQGHQQRAFKLQAELHQEQEPTVNWCLLLLWHTMLAFENQCVKG